MVATDLPGKPEMPEDLPGRLRAALESQGPTYVPRTHHLVGARPKFINRLMLETSPYLLQHAHNPVNWYPWSDEAFEDARRLGRPVFLSIGYSTCHWCHVMEGESFEDEEIAAYMNEHYVCIKVDREERPDVDAIYMAATQRLSGSGGWPMSVFLLFDRTPFFAGTYFPPRDGARGAQHGFLTILRELRKTHDQDPGRVRQAAESLTRAVQQEMQGAAPAQSAGIAGPEVIAATIDYYKKAFDTVHGGLRRAPKFPSNVPVRLLLRHHRRTGDADALHMASFTLEKMAAGGMYDQLGGGFHRYSTDARWLVPHFEKMLYDNALLAVSYAEAWQVTGRADFARVLRETLDYVLREMTSPEGGFYSATDADSEGEEGKFFVWSKQEIDQLLGAEAARFAKHYDVTEGGNFEGHNILNVQRPDEGEHAALAAARQKLYQVRQKRVPPLRDDKILAAWNGLMISGLAMGGRVLGERRYVEAAARAADFLLTKMREGDRLSRSYKDGRKQQHGFLEDQAFVAQGLLDLFEATFERRWLAEAIALSDALEKHFPDREHGGWFMTADDAEKLIAREKPTYDGAEPSGTSVAILNVLRLQTFTDDERWRAVAEKALRSLHEVLSERPLAMTEALVALDYFHDVPREVALVWPAGHPPDDLQAVLRATFLPSRALAGAPEGDIAALAKLVPFVGEKVAQGGKPTGYVCRRGKCELPATDPGQFRAQLSKLQ
ncbi:MAG TPA: thioredoxin domain-containing protein [Polyangia bacterium]|nr:thioredoxin domain-containing protein [Polyangia bacterium]